MKYLPLVAMLYVTVKLIAILLLYRMVTVFGVTAAASTLIIPLWFLIGDCITEIYGHHTARKLVYMAALCQLLFGVLTWAFNFLDSADIGINQHSYIQVFNNLPRGAFASVAAIIAGGLINSWILSRWQAVLCGKYFIIRSLGASMIGELIFTICVYVMSFYGSTSYIMIIKLIWISYVIKIAVNLILSIPIAIIVDKIKQYVDKCQVKTHNNLNLSSITLTILSQNEAKLSIFTQDNIYISTADAAHKQKSIKNGFIMKRLYISNNQQWHCASQPQYLLILSGKVEIHNENHEVKSFGVNEMLYISNNSKYMANVIEEGQALLIFMPISHQYIL